ncbi:hypothetical protein FHS85_003715 [Rhodoligotrophos appendicifer]|uniref:lysylphosphatidylglycerol synthase domain-containing protein n=1 Tax=Rhodoligotrophos appendicifer TaxID=987056 RepID=UPI001184F887|nr:lysylphosphatidylglycerol synthase domain-containing protein [Rhodoligotrophos appendicifer]
MASPTSPAATRPHDSKASPRPLKRWLSPAIAVVATGVAAFLLYRALKDYSAEELIAAVTGFPVERLLFAALFAALSYLCLTGFDMLALRYVQKPLPYPKVALTSFTALSIGHTIGLAALSSGAVRYRFYSRWGLSLAEIAQVIVFCGLTVGVGLVTLGGIALLARPDLAAEVTGVSRALVIGIGISCVIAIAAYLAAAAFYRRKITIRGEEIALPPFRLAIGQIIIGATNFAAVAACLHQVLMAVSEVSYLQTAAVYVIANTLALVSHVPGGLGVIESVVMYLVQGKTLIGALLVFRFTYFLAPFVLGLLLFGASELFYRRRARA